MRLIDAIKLFREIENNKDIESLEKLKFLTIISEQETAVSLIDLMMKVGSLECIAINGKPYVNLEDVLKIITRRQ